MKNTAFPILYATIYVWSTVWGTLLEFAYLNLRRFSVVLNVKMNFVVMASQILPLHAQNLASLTYFLLYEKTPCRDNYVAANPVPQGD